MARSEELVVADVGVTHPDKVLLPAREGGDPVTKADLARYWEAVAGTVLPHLAGRPLTLQRFPDGLDAGGFVQQDAGKRAPEGLHIIDTPRREQRSGADEVVHHPEVEELADLIRLVQFGTVTLHGWNAVAGALERPDRLIVDIDPGDTADLAGIRDVARAVGRAVEDRGLVPFLQSTGSRGYHVVAPLDASAGHDHVKGVAQEIADIVAAGNPSELTTAVRKDARRGRTFLDIGRNAYGQTAVVPYSPRARPGAPTATPLDWDELGRVRPDQHDIRSIPRRLSRKTDPWAGFADHARAPG
ncbi:DNA polymerase domain-containing protein [Actinomycetospora cinnamomea]|uniref:Bifunctional non-homologous end joining protein LigD n=1 Tax=Actinomycetospora cinnamomea TaxID=663609 RepID=A0A2U1FFT0_9PSEU|nr:ATP-dependent DNA ligase [Actinomycetospora cinnamomea]PVZ11054.1 bifunctional non-homologous end joining protein LigD [Actinomycetospora cinnamomea]